MRCTRGFTLIELLVVIAILGIGAGLISTITFKRDERRALVQGAATELAGVLRQARAYAMDRNIIAAVSFNIENAPGSTGWVLNNRSGGHWYQIAGAAQMRVGSDASLGTQAVQAGHFPFPQRLGGGWLSDSSSEESPIRLHVESMGSAWYGDRHVLPKGKVRFLAIGDQDNGMRYRHSDAYQPSGSDFFYPRPWFGRWDDVGKRLYPWGGYQPQFKGTATYADNTTKASPTGFFYEGKDGPITGSVHPSDRLVHDDGNGDMMVKMADGEYAAGAKRFKLWSQGKPRPVIDATWLDLYLVFYPDGTIAFGMPLTLRRLWGEQRGGSMRCYGDGQAIVSANRHYQNFKASNNNVQLIGPGDRCSPRDPVDDSFKPEPRRMFEVGNYLSHTGAFYITLGPDVPVGEDEGRYPSAAKAIDAMMPMYRVCIRPGGDITWFEVKRFAPQGVTVGWVPGITPASWSTQTFIEGSYPDGSLRNADSSPRGRPVVDMLLPEMLTQANWWMP